MNASTPNFDTLYGPALGNAKRPAMLPMLTTRPRDFLMSGRNVSVTSMSPKRFTADACNAVNIKSDTKTGTRYRYTCNALSLCWVLHSIHNVYNKATELDFKHSNEFASRELDSLLSSMAIRDVRITVGRIRSGILITEPSQNPLFVKMEFRTHWWQVASNVSVGPVRLWADCERYYRPIHSDLLFPVNLVY
jgi:hypothetical protein